METEESHADDTNIKKEPIMVKIQIFNDIFTKWVLIVIAIATFFTVREILLHKECTQTPASQKSDSGAAVSEFQNGTNFDDCQTTGSKKNFPNMDYVFMGYNILKGYPLAAGPDPGFTYPIFRADYSNGGHTADCRYNLPKGLIITSDVSCVTSFSSQIVQTQYELLKKLSTSTSVGVGGVGSRAWGVSFSASTGFKQAVSIVSNAKFVVIYSTANCNYYICKLEKMQPPPFDANFLKWVNKLNKTISNESLQERSQYFDFFEHYGTHFFHTATFGASFIHEYKMSSLNYTSMRESGIDIAAAASVSSLFISVQSELNLVASKKLVANKFLDSVEERTITKGAPPPADGEAKTWASIVQETPIPTAYILGSLEDLFTEEFMESLGVRYDEIRNKIIMYKNEYCNFLRSKGLIDNCLDSVDVIVLEGTEIIGDAEVETLSRSVCHDRCQESTSCVAVDFCNDCTRTDENYNQCHMYYEGKYLVAKSNTAIETTIWMSNIERDFVLNHTAVTGRDRSSECSLSENVEDCMQKCLDDEHCVVFTFCNCSAEKIKNCKLYAQDGIFKLKAEHGSETHFISKKSNSTYDICSSKKPTTFTGN